MPVLRGKTILVTGASAGIGFAAAELLAIHGGTVIACARNVQPLEDLEDVYAIKCDLSKEADVMAMFKEVREKYGKLEVLINNAGAGSSTAGLIGGQYQSWKDILDLNVLGLSLASREAIKLMELDGSQGGHIVNINSITGHIVPTGEYRQFYAGSKHMVKALTDGLRKSVQSRNIRVSSVSPGLVETEFAKRSYGAGYSDMAAKMYTDYKCLEAKDVANAILYIVSAPLHVNVDELTLSPLHQDFNF